MLSRTITLVLAMLLISTGLSAADDPLIGTWKLNLSKSKYRPGPPPKSQMNKYEPSGANGVKLITDSVNAKGEANHEEIANTFDGKEYPAPNFAGGGTMMMNKRINAYTTVRTLRKGGKVVNTLRRVVSKDGKTMTVTQKGTDAEGKPVSTVQVYDKQ
jgi:hypothetical protein